MLAGQPVIILKQDVERTRGEEALRSNIMAAKAIAGAVRTTLGPRGMDKMLVSPSGDVVITNDGATILHELKVQHPAAKMMIEVAEAQDDEVGDGTTTACVLTGRLVEEAEELIAQNVHPTVIAKGFRMGLEEGLRLLKEMAIEISPDDRERLMKIAETAMSGKSIEAASKKIRELVVDAVSTVATRSDGKITIDEDDVMIKKKVGESMDDASLIRGVVIDKKRVNRGMPRVINDAKVALISSPLEIVKTQVKSKIKITSADQMEAFDAQEKDTLRKLAESIRDSGANVVLCQKGIADAVQFYLAKFGILGVEDVPEKDMKFAARALDATIATKVNDLTPDSLGHAERVEELIDKETVVISGCQNPKAVTILLRGTTQSFVDELERAVHDAVRVVQSTMEDGQFVVGGGATEIELHMKILDYATRIGGRVQLAIEAFARALEAIPRTLAENSGMNPVDQLVALKAAHARGEVKAGLDLYTGEIADMEERGVLEPLRVKTQAIMSAAETASMLIRVDDMMITMPKESKKESKK
ncbi:MAG: thermosome subunit alpha [Methanoculleaceae archaeon]